MSLSSVGLNSAAHSVQRKPIYVLGRMLYALLPIFLGLFCDLSNLCEQLLLQRDMITSSGAKPFPSPKMDIAWHNFAYLCKVPVSINSETHFTYAIDLVSSSAVHMHAVDLVSSLALLPPRMCFSSHHLDGRALRIRLSRGLALVITVSKRRRLAQ